MVGGAGTSRSRNGSCGAKLTKRPPLPPEQGGHLVEGITSLDDLKNVELHLFAYNSDTYDSLGEYVTTID